MNQQNTTMVYGINAVGELINARAKSIICLNIESSRKDRRIQVLLDAARQNGVRVDRLEKSLIESKMLDAGLDPQDLVYQGVLAECKLSEIRDEHFLKQLLEKTERPLLLLLDGVTDPHNLGACLRSANAAGVDAVIIPKDNAVGLTPAVRKVACGAAELTPLVRAKNLARCIDTIKQAGVWVMGAAGESDSSLYELDLGVAVAIVMGAEGRGLRRLTRDKCDQLFAIPMDGGVESLNVSVAAGISLFEALRQRQV